MTAPFPRDRSAAIARPDSVALDNGMGADYRSEEDYGSPRAPIPMATRIASV